MIQLIIATAIVLLILYTIRNIVALPIGLIMMACGVERELAIDRSRWYVQNIFKTIVAIICIIGIIVTGSLLMPAFGELFGAIGALFKALIELI